MTKQGEANVLNWDIATLSNAIEKKQVSPIEVTRQLLERIQSTNKILNAYITVLDEEALAEAKRVEKKIMTGDRKGPLHGIPVALKDLIYTKGTKTTMGSEIYKDYVPDYNATVVEKLREAGAIIIGKLNTHEFAYGPTGDKSFFGAVKNPYNLSKVTGGSSSGSGAAVAASLCYAALGTDTGGSIRIPASFCGIVGMKPTFGRVSKYGVFPLGWTLDHVGPMTRTVEDNAIVLGALSGYDERDPYSVRKDTENFTRYLRQGIKGCVIGVPSLFYFQDLDDEVADTVTQAIESFKNLGAKIKMIEIPRMKEISLAQQMTLKCEAYAVHIDTIRNHQEQLDEDVKERILTGSSPKAHEYIEAQQVKYMAVREFTTALKEADVILTPTVPILPTDIGQREICKDGNKELVRSVLTRLTGPTNLVGFPSLSIPGGFSSSGLPIGLQLIGRPYDEATLYRVGYAWETENFFHRMMDLRL